MNRRTVKSIFPRMLAFTGVVVLSAGMALAQVAASSAPAAAGRPDGQIEMDVVHALDAAAPLKDDLITAATIQSEVTLSGTVSSAGSKDLAESIARGVAGVTKVHNNLTVGDPKQAAQDEGLSQDDDVALNDPAQAPPQNESMPMPDNSRASAPPNSYPQQPGYPAPDQGQQQYPAQPYPQARPQYSPNQPPPPPQYGQQQVYGYPQQPGNQQPQYSQPAYNQSSGPVTIAPGTLLQLRTSEPVDSKRAVNGAPVQFTAIQDVSAGGALAIPRGATVHGVVTEVRQTQQGDLGGRSELALTLTSIDLGGQTYPVQSDEFRVQGPSKAGNTAGNVIAGGLIGTIIGCAVGRGTGCAVGAGAGLAAGTAVSAAQKGAAAWIPAEAQVTFHLAAPLTVNPVSQQEAQRLAQGLYPGGPTLYQRPPTRQYYGPGFAPYYGYPAYGYPYYPRPYYRPYYMVGGAYFWR